VAIKCHNLHFAKKSIGLQLKMIIKPIQFRKDRLRRRKDNFMDLLSFFKSYYGDGWVRSFNKMLDFIIHRIFT
jgi:hypothetical protein